MLKWKSISFAFTGALVMLSAAFVAVTPGWKVSLAESAGYTYTEPQSATFHMTNSTTFPYWTTQGPHQISDWHMAWITSHYYCEDYSAGHDDDVNVYVVYYPSLRLQVRCADINTTATFYYKDGFYWDKAFTKKYIPPWNNRIMLGAIMLSFCSQYGQLPPDGYRHKSIKPNQSLSFTCVVPPPFM